MPARASSSCCALDEPDAAEQPERLVVSRDVLGETLGAGHGRVVVRATVGRDEDVEAPEALGAGALEQRESRLGIGGEQRGGVRRERGSDRLLEPALDLEALESQPSSLGREGARGGRDPLSLLERALERREPVARGARPLGEIVPLGRGTPRLGGRLVRPVSSSAGAGAAFAGCARRPRAAARGRGRAPPPARAARAAARAPRRARRAHGWRSPSRRSAHRGHGRPTRALARGGVEPPLRLALRPPARAAASSAWACRARSAVLPLSVAASRAAAAASRDASSSARTASSDRVASARSASARSSPSRAASAAERLGANGQALSRTLQPVESTERALARACRVGQLDLRGLALREDHGQPLLRRSASERGRAPPRVGLRLALLERREVERRDACTQVAISPASFSARSAAVAWRARGRSRLRTSSSTSRARSTWVATRASFSSARWRRRLNFPSPAASSTSARRSSGLDASTASTFPCETIECIVAAEADVREQLDEIGTANRCAVDEVLALAAADEPPRDRHLAEVELLAEPTVLVVEHELDLAVVGGGPGRRAAEEDVVGPVGAKLGRRQRARRPDDRVRRRSTCRTRSGRPRRRPRARGTPRRRRGTT